jgi:glycosyltransferase involved in cell wall biosynthesis
MQEAAESGLSGIRFMGGMPWHEVPTYLAQADVLILPSLSEPWGLVVNEAMVCAMPVIVSRNCGCVDDLVRHGQNGFSFKAQKVEELAEAMRHYITHPDDIAVHGAKSLELIASFSPTSVGKEMATAFHKLAN